MYDTEQLNAIDNAISEHLIGTGLDDVIFMDLSGNAIAKHSNGKTNIDASAFAALAAGNYAAVDAMARLIGETEFSLLFHKGEKLSIHFSKVTEETLLIAMFSKNISLGLVRLNVAKAIEEITRALS